MARTKAAAAKPKRAAKPAAKAKAPARKATRAKATRKVAAKAAPKPKVRYAATPADKSDKEHLASIIQSGTGCTAKAAKATLDAVIGTVSATLKKNQKVQLTGFGSFNVTKRPARMGRNPRTGEKVRIKASKSVRFRAGKTLKDSV